MYDYLLAAAESFIRYGLSPTALVVAIIALFKTKKVKRMIGRRIPWLFRDESDVLNYQARQIRIESKLDTLLEERGIVWHGQSETLTSGAPSYETLLQSSPEETSERRSSMKKVILDPGHGGKDPGTSGNGIVEKQYALHVALRVRNKLLEDYTDVEVVMTRDGDYFVDLADRSMLSNMEKADLFASFHLNSPSTTGGFETFRYPSPNRNLEMQRTIHNAIFERISRYGPVIDRGLKQGNFSVLRRTVAPAILIEYMFVSSPSDAAMLKREEVIAAMVEGTVDGIAQVLHLTPRAGSKSVTVMFRSEQTVQGMLIDGQTWVPSRPTAEIMGGSVTFVAGIVYVDKVPYDTQIINGTGFIRLRDLAQSKGAQVEFDNATKTTLIRMRGE